jgi:hypothetical protein
MTAKWQGVSDVSSPFNDYNLGCDRAGRILVFARSGATSTL